MYPKSEGPDTSCHSVNIRWMNECSLNGLMSDIGLKLEEPAEKQPRAAVECDDDVTG